MATKTSIPHNPHDPLFELGVGPNGAKYYRQFVRPWEFFPQSGGATVAALNSTLKVKGLQSITITDSGVTLQPIPDNYDRGQDAYIRVIFSNTTGADADPTWLVKYLPLALGDDFATDPFNTALDDPITATTETTIAVSLVRSTVYGRIAANSFGDDDFLIAIEAECDANDSVSTWYLIGLEILWPKLLY